MENKFIFSEVEEGFDTHIINSIPGYDVFLQETNILSKHWINDDSLPIIDIGGSTGKLLDYIQKSTKIETKHKFFNVDPTVFSSRIDNDLITFVHDSAQNYLKNVDNVQLFFSIFTLQFLNDTNRSTIISQISNKMDVNGAFFVAEKFFMEDSEYQELFSVALRHLKRSYFSSNDILDKDVALLKHLKLKKESQFIEEMNDNGMKATKYWQSLHFNGFICERM